jgi:hypothetical protein
MKRLLLVFAVFAGLAHGRDKLQGWCQEGGITATAGSVSVSPTVQASRPSCTVTVYKAGTTNLASIFADNAGTPKANPFTAAATGLWFFYADPGRFDVRFSGGGIPTPFTLGDYVLFDPADQQFDITDPKYGAVCDGATNDAAAIQAAIDAAIVTGGAVAFPPGKTCSLGATGISIGTTLNGVRLFAPSFATTTLTYSGTAAALTVGVQAAATFTYRHTIENLQIDITGAGASAVAIQVNPSLYVTLRNNRLYTNNAYAVGANQQVGLKLVGGSAADATFGAYLVWEQNQIQGKFRKGVYMTATDIGWGFNSCTFTGGAIVYSGSPQVGYIGFHLEQGNQNLIELIDAEHYATEFKSEAYANTWVAIRTETEVGTISLELAAATGSTTGGTFNRVIGSFLGAGVTNNASGSQVWATETDIGLENHITGEARLDVTLQVTANSSILWNVLGGSAGLFWRNTSGGATQAGVYDNGNLQIFAGTAAINSDLILDGVNSGSTIRLRNQGTDKVLIDGSGVTTFSTDVLFSGNFATKFVNVGGGGSTGFAWYTAPAAAFSGSMVDNGAQELWQAGVTGTVARDAVIDVKNAASAFRVQRATVNYMVIDSNGLNIPVGIYKNSAGFQHIRLGSCTTAAAIGATCDSTITWNTTFADALYTMTCTIDNPTNVPYVLSTNTKLAASIKVTIAALTAAAASGTLNCVAVHE